MKDRENTNLTRDTWIIHVAVVLSYFGKATVKAVSGFLLGSPPLINDSIHSIIDIWEHGLIAVVGRQARKEAEARFPLGRKALLDVVGFVIGLSMAGLGLKCLKDGFAAALHAMDVMFGIKGLLPSWLASLLPELTHYGTPSRIWIVGAIFTACALVSFAVYYLEYGLARKHRLKEYKDDATELRQDAVLELATGLCVIGAWLLVIVVRAFAGTAWSFEAVNAVTTAVVLLGLCAYLLLHAKHAIVENVNNLLHPGLDQESVDLLKSHLNRSLPSGCDLVNEKASDLTAYTSGDVLHVSGMIRIPRTQLAVGDVILEHAQHIARAFLRSKAGDVKVRFFPVPEEWEHTDAEAEWRRLLTEIWSVQPQGVAWNCFSALKRGDVQALYQLPNMAQWDVSSAEQVLCAWVQATTALYRDGGRSTAVDVVSRRIDGILDEMDVGDARCVAFHCWRVLCAVTSGLIHDETARGDYDASRNALASVVNGASGVPDVLRAEAEFILGMLAERQDGYDLGHSDRRYRNALALYLSSGFPLEADRLLNTWGHQKSLLFEIEEACYLLNRSRHIKILKGDQLGLAFTLGCLGDTHRRAGEFDKAIACYADDLRVTESLGTDHAAASVTCKLAETEICAGFVGGSESQMDQGIQRLRDLFRQRGLPEQVRFFTGKGLAKGLLWLATVSNDEGRIRLLSEAENVLSRTVSFSPYSDAHLNRLLGRLARLRGNDEAATLLIRAKEGFAGMRGDIESRINSLQAICCAIEAAMACGHIDRRVRQVRVACDELKGFVDSLQGLLGSAHECLESLLEPVCTPRRQPVLDDNALNRLLAFLEG